MALPIPGNNPRKAEDNNDSASEEQSLPNLDAFALPVPPAVIKFEPPAARRQASAPRVTPAPVETPPVDDGWAIDPSTGVKYKKLAANDPEATRAFVRSGGKGLSLDELRRYSAQDESFDIDDLNNTAETFLAHLRVPVPKEELEAARRARAARLQTEAE